MKQVNKNNRGYENFYSFVAILILLFVVLGCRSVSNLLNPDRYSSSGNTTSSNSSTTSSSDAAGKIQKKAYALAGQWGGKSFDNSKNVTFHFESPSKIGDKYVGRVTTDVEGVKAGTEKYIVTDEVNVEFETQKGMKYTVKAEISADGETLTMTAANGITTSYNRE